MQSQSQGRKRLNFTKISDVDLMVKSSCQHWLGSLRYYRVLRTRELMEKIDYKKGIKSFRKFLKKCERMELIGRKKEFSNSCYYIYPKEKLLRERKQDRWRDFLVQRKDVDSLKFYWQTGRIYEILSSLKNCTESNSYINSDGSWFDFQFDHFIKRRMIYGIYTCVYDDWDESEEEGFQKGRIFSPIILSRFWNEKFQRGMIEHWEEGGGIDGAA